MSSQRAASSHNRYQTFESRRVARSAISPAVHSTHRFRVLALPKLLACLTELAQTLEQEGVRAILCTDYDAQHEVGVHLPDLEASVSVRPAPGCPFLQATAQAGRNHPRRLDWFIPYHFLESEAIDRELRAAVEDLIRTHLGGQAPP